MDLRLYNKEHDVIVISKTGQIGEIYDIQGLKIALPKQKEAAEFQNNKWEHTVLYPKELKKIKSVFDWDEYPVEFKEKWYDYIDTEFKRREEGFWFINKDKPTYITGTHYMYLQWSKIDVGQPDFRESNRLFYLFWEACKADQRCYGMCYLKNRRSGFSFMASGETVNQATISTDSQDLVFYPNPDQTRKRCLLIRSYPSPLITLSFSNQSRTEWTARRRNYAYRVPASKFTTKKLDSNEKLARDLRSRHHDRLEEHRGQLVRW